MNIWAIVKVAVIIFVAITSAFGNSYAEVNEVVGWEAVIVGLLFFPLIVLVGLFLLKVIFRRKLDFETPSWKSNPLDFSHPEHFFHFGGLVMVTSGIAGMLAVFIKSRVISISLCAPLAFGIGILFGIWVLKVVHTNQALSSNRDRELLK